MTYVLLLVSVLVTACLTTYTQAFGLRFPPIIRPIIPFHHKIGIAPLRKVGFGHGHGHGKGYGNGYGYGQAGNVGGYRDFAGMRGGFRRGYRGDRWDRWDGAFTPDFLE